jgi:hypothetical protein
VKTEIAELFGIDKLEKQNPAKAQDALDAWDKIMNENDAETQKRVFLHALGAHRLNESTQLDLIDKLETIVELAKNDKPIPKSLHEFYYGTPETVEVINEKVKAADYKWSKDVGKSNSNVAFMTEKQEVIKKDYFTWGQSGSYGSTQDK